MPPLFGLLSLVSAEVQEQIKMLFSLASLAVTLYFWLIRANRERMMVKVYPVSGFEGCRDNWGTGLWTGQLYLANCSIMPTAIVAAKVVLCWKGRWVAGNCVPNDGSELPWNLAPSTVFAKKVTAAFDVKDATLEQIYADQRLRFTFETVEGKHVTKVVQTGQLQTAAAAA